MFDTKVPYLFPINAKVYRIIHRTGWHMDEFCAAAELEQRFERDQDSVNRASRRA